MIAWVGLATLAGEEGERDICQPPAENEGESGPVRDSARPTASPRPPPAGTAKAIR